MVFNGLFIANPILRISQMFVLGVLEGMSIMESLIKTKEKIFNVWLISVNIYTPIAFLNFYFFPFHFQILVNNVIGFIFKIWFNWFYHKNG